MTTCSTCRHCWERRLNEYRDPYLVCRRWPPNIVSRTTSHVVVDRQGGKETVYGSDSSSRFPVVEADWTCGEWKTREEP